MTWTYEEWQKRVEDITWERDTDHDVLFEDWTEDRERLQGRIKELEEIIDALQAYGCIVEVKGIIERGKSHREWLTIARQALQVQEQIKEVGG